MLPPFLRVERFMANVAAEWQVAGIALKTFNAIDGAHRAAAFAFYTLFSIFPLAVLCVFAVSLLSDKRIAVQKVIDYAGRYLPLEGEMRQEAVERLSGIVDGRGHFGLLATLLLVWGSLQLFTALVRATTRAWKMETHNWWQMRAKCFVLLAVLGSAVMLGIGLTMGANRVGQALPGSLAGGTSGWVRAGIHLTVLFSGLILFYRLAPREKTRFSQLWASAAFAALTLWLAGVLFSVYLRYFATFDAIYGALGGVMALMVWVYLSGCIIVFGSCRCAAGANRT